VDRGIGVGRYPVFRILLGIFIILHGLVHLWYFTLSQRLVPFEPEMGWTGRSWLLTGILGDNTARTIASVLFVLATFGFVAGGVGYLADLAWWRTVLIVSAVLSAVTTLIFWDGSAQYIVQKGLLGFLIDIGILLWLLVF
jgi:hypothetical protein